MVKYIKGDVLNCKATLVAHQVNAFGVMGGGIAAAIWPLLTPESQSAYVEKCRHNAKLPVTEWMGSIQILDTKREELKICNLFTQFPAPVDGSFDLTAYNYLRQALDLLRVYAVFNDYDIVGVPARIGCGIAGGDWDKVQRIIHDVYDDSGITMLIVDNQEFSLHRACRAFCGRFLVCICLLYTFCTTSLVIFSRIFSCFAYCI